MAVLSIPTVGFHARGLMLFCQAVHKFWNRSFTVSSWILQMEDKHTSRCLRFHYGGILFRKDEFEN